MPMSGHPLPNLRLLKVDDCGHASAALECQKPGFYVAALCG
jgi:hypothetical protein